MFDRDPGKKIIPYIPDPRVKIARILGTGSGSTIITTGNVKTDRKTEE
jgi:hypothetical protein